MTNQLLINWTAILNNFSTQSSDFRGCFWRRIRTRLAENVLEELRYGHGATWSEHIRTVSRAKCVNLQSKIAKMGGFSNKRCKASNWKKKESSQLFTIWLFIASGVLVRKNTCLPTKLAVAKVPLRPACKRLSSSNFFVYPCNFICVLLTLSLSFHNARQLTFCFQEVRPPIFHELSNRAEAAFWQESQRVSQEKLAAAALTFVQRCSSITNFSSAGFGPDQTPQSSWVSWDRCFYFPIHMSFNISWGCIFFPGIAWKQHQKAECLYPRMHQMFLILILPVSEVPLVLILPMF